MSEVPVGIGKSSPQGTITLSWARPIVGPEGHTTNGMYIVCENATLQLIQTTKRTWIVKLVGAEKSGVENVEKEAQQEGVPVEIAMFGKAVSEAKAGQKQSQENWAEPRNSLWDLAVIEAMLNSEGKEIQLERS